MVEADLSVHRIQIRGVERVIEIIKIVVITMAMLIYLRTLVFILSVAHSKDAYNRDNIMSIEAELKQLEENRMAREKKRSMR